MRKIGFCLLFTFSLANFSQNKFAKEFRFVNDNDLYTSIVEDRYYSNGLFLSYRYVSQSQKKTSIKKIYNFKIGHQIYTPFKAIVATKEEHDRPFAGYLFGSFAIDYFYKNNAIFKSEIQIGVIGESAAGKEIQNSIHDIYGYKEAVGWKYQIKNAFALNLNVSYIQNLWTSTSNLFDFNWYNNVKIGTIFTSATTGFYTRVGIKPFQNLVNSIAFNGNLNTKSSDYNKEIEVFIYAKPTFSYVHYDATIQGSFLNTSSPVTYELKNLQFAGEFGLLFTANRFNLGYIINFYSKKLKSLRVPNTINYGTVKVIYQFN